jgi:hypothetical protein
MNSGCWGPKRKASSWSEGKCWRSLASDAVNTISVVL